MRTPWTASATRCKKLAIPLRSSKEINPLTGPFYIEGAEPGDTLVVHIPRSAGRCKQGVGTFSPGFGAINATHYTPMLEKEALPEKIWFYPSITRTTRPRFRPLIPTTKSKSRFIHFLAASVSLPPMGKREVPSCPRNSAATWTLRKSPLEIPLYLSVNVAGALFYFGDGHAAMGDGELRAAP